MAKLTGGISHFVHKKVSKRHTTTLTKALPMLSAACALNKVTGVALGRISRCKSSTPWIKVTSNDHGPLMVKVSANRWVQEIRISAKNHTHVARVVSKNFPGERR